MWSCIGHDHLLIAAAIVLGACGGDPDAHLVVTRADNLRVIVQLCDPADIAQCKTSDLFAATDAIPTEKTIDIFVDDSTPVLVARFTQSTTPMPICTDLTLTFADTPDAHVALSGDPAGDVTGCETCSIQACVQ